MQENANHAHLLNQFTERLLVRQPRSVLDVGCGEGALLQRCLAAGIPSAGIESDAAAVHPLQARGMHVVQAAAGLLPFGDRSFDWVTMRHVPHHLPDPGAALAEAVRVCESGLIVAEPWFDPEIPSQRSALAVDRWLKRQHRSAGMVHNEALSPDALRRALPASMDDFSIDVDIVLRLRPRPIESFEEEARPLLAVLPGEHPDRSAYDELLRDIRRDGLSWNGSAMLTVCRV